MQQRLVIFAGEASGDAHAAELIRHLKRLRPELDLMAFGGKRVEKAGAKLVYPLAERGVVGGVEVLQNLGFFRKALAEARSTLNRYRPDGVVLIDAPGFNFRIAEIAHRLDIPVIYYIAPQVWAWKKNRLKAMKRWARKVLVILPFETHLYEDAGIPVQFVGHPLVDVVEQNYDRPAIREELNIDPEATVVGLMPGSRTAEVHRMLHLFLDCAERIGKKIPGVSFLLPLAETLPRDILGELPPEIRVVENPTFAHRAVMDFALTKSGTGTLENGLLGLPMAIVYRVAWSTYFIAKRIVDIEYIGLVNILAGKEVCKEFIQNEASPEAIVDYACSILKDDNLRNSIRQQLLSLRRQLGGSGASSRAAQAVVETLEL